ncbi:hypothetical protein H112_01823 [Trichophyton rubrum D6]|uniref:Store-operated calcium entry-associated regulatory factor n=4 Tax=Trichophyton TaxID=5550 RepID=A0A178EZ40_TRIRU|nr:hypothetical protein H100_01819 [Trichophyton rubrum MR850]EZF44983.1 hypothetical protein H102_01814 [Trichophyton rubrum CBS 100081]EZF55667.1 hypothetical protein H103_01824 [Trichophyton rubrum CBS 288.86]EZF66250.1 hypothetical protein H104_01801 [Trichophyton rubrum CBS 289.86]EZF76879.1 hypothetical protein H105_01828 [Trichophyton soudanense CBS 452.61]EZF87649.1 hypothetical protein H110_01825 [Trichophyton rubrum MR1448]EZG19889.1 hypothetical protein H107_01883 [Trichophyton rub
MAMFAAVTCLVALSALLQPVASYGNNKSPSKNAVLLSDVQTLTFHANRKTTHRRVSAIPQLNCVGPSKEICSLYKPDVIRCSNEGYDYDENDVQWTCTAQLPPEFKLGGTEVVCEGYRNSNDPWILKGSCGVEYRLLLTSMGEKRYGHIPHDRYGYDESIWSTLIRMAVFFGLFMAVVKLLQYCTGIQGQGWGRNGAGGGGGGGGGGGWWPPGPPPPYDYQQPRFAKDDWQSWRPGFWTGALGGTAAGYAMGRGSRRGGDNTFRSGSNNAASGPSFSSSTRESTGFGGTRRR